MPARWTGIETVGPAKDDGPLVRQILALVVPTPLSLRLAPHWGFPPPGIRSHEAIVVQRCPEGTGEGPVLACTKVRCGIYDDVSEVPPLTPEHLEMALTVSERYLPGPLPLANRSCFIPKFNQPDMTRAVIFTDAELRNASGSNFPATVG